MHGGHRGRPKRCQREYCNAGASGRTPDCRKYLEPSPQPTYPLPPEQEQPEPLNHANLTALRLSPPSVPGVNIQNMWDVATNDIASTDTRSEKDANWDGEPHLVDDKVREVSTVVVVSAVSPKLV